MENGITKKRNGEIDLIRLIFALIICLGHWYVRVTGNTMGMFYTGVEFFFILSGFFMAASGRKTAECKLSNSEIGNSTWKFLGRKIKAFFRYYVFAVILRFIVKCVIVDQCGIKDGIMHILKSSSLFTLTFVAVDVGGNPMYSGATWYLSAMILALFLLYPIMLKFGDVALKIIFPLLALGIFGYFFGNGLLIVTWNRWLGFCYAGLFRAIAGIALGAFLYPASIALSDKINKSGSRALAVFCAVIKYGIWLVVFIAALRGFGLREVDMIFLISFAVLLSFAVPQYSIHESRFTKIASKLSLGIYIFHCVFRDVCKDMMDLSQAGTKTMIVLFAVSVVGSIILTYLTDIICNALGKLVSRISNKKRNSA